MALEHLFSPLTIRGLTFRNRIFSTGHQTNMVEGGAPSARMAAYHEARAAGGAGLIIIEAARMHDTALSDGLVLDVSRGETVAGYARVVEAVNRPQSREDSHAEPPPRELPDRPSWRRTD